LQQQSKDGSSFTALRRTGERGPAQEAAAQPEVVDLNNRMELRRSEEQFRRIAAPLICLTHLNAALHCKDQMASHLRNG